MIDTTTRRRALGMALALSLFILGGCTPSADSGLDRQSFALTGFGGNGAQVAGSTGKALAATVFNGRVFLFAAGNGQDQEIYVNSAPADTTDFVGWGAVGGTTDVPLAATSSNNQLYLFRKEITEHKIYVAVAPPGAAFGAWTEVGGATSAPLAATTFNNLLFAFANSDGTSTPYVNSEGVDHPWVGWGGVGGSLVAPPAATAFDNKLYLFALSPGGSQVYYNVALPGQAFRGWDAIPSTLPGGATVQPPIATTTFNGRVYVFARGSDNGVYFNSALPQQPFGAQWSHLPASGLTTDAAPAVAATATTIYIAVKQVGGAISVITRYVL